MAKKERKLFWTQSAVDCYRSGGRCSGRCSNYAICKGLTSATKEPPMKELVRSLIKNMIKIPLAYSTYSFNSLTNSEMKVLREIMRGVRREELKALVKMNEDSLASALSTLYSKMDLDLSCMESKKKYPYFAKWCQEHLVDELAELDMRGEYTNAI